MRLEDDPPFNVRYCVWAKDGDAGNRIRILRIFETQGEAWQYLERAMDCDREMGFTYPADRPSYIITAERYG